MKLYIILIFSILPILSNSQNLENLLESIKQNNRSLTTHNKLIEQEKTSNKINLFLPDPEIELDFMKGAPVGAGNQFDLTILQSFDLPGSYKRKKKLSYEKSQKLDITASQYRQEILSEAKSLYIEIIYFNKLKKRLSIRQSNMKDLLASVQHQFEAGSATILELNKHKLSVAKLQNELNLTETDRREALTELRELNGGEAIIVEDTLYPLTDVVPTLEEMIEEAEAGDLLVQEIEQDIKISAYEQAVAKSETWPTFEAGYRLQTILGQNFNGFHTGLSIPLFEHKYKVKAARQQSDYYRFLLESHMNEHSIHIESLHKKVLNLRQNMLDYEKAIQETSNIEYLHKALKYGQITSMEYFNELNYYYEAYDTLLLMEREYRIVLAELLKYKL